MTTILGAVKQWAADTTVRAVKTAAQTLAGLLAASQTPILHATLITDLKVSGLAAAACYLHNLQSLNLPAFTVAGETFEIDGEDLEQAALDALDALHNTPAGPAVGDLEAALTEAPQAQTPAPPASPVAQVDPATGITTALPGSAS